MARDNCFDFLRLFAALTVVVQHSTMHFGVPCLWLKPFGPLWFYDGVPMFFVMSGLLVFRSAHRCRKQNLPMAQFFGNRALRIVPAIYIYLLVSIVLITSVASITAKEMIKFIGSTLLLLPVYTPPGLRHFGVGSWNGSLWTIPAEVSFYITVPLLVLLYERIASRQRFALVLALLITGSAALSCGVELSFHDSMIFKAYQLTFLWGFPFFGMGVFWAITWDSVKHSWYFALLSAAIYLGLSLWVRPHYLRGLGWYFASAIPLSYLTIWIGYNGPRVLSRFTKTIGDLSYGTYIWHMVIINVLIYAGIERTNLGHQQLIHALVLAATTVAAYISWRLIEKPALGLKRFSSRAPEQVLVSRALA